MAAKKTDEEIVTAFAIEALGLVDHFHFLNRVTPKDKSKSKAKRTSKAKPKRKTTATTKARKKTPRKTTKRSRR